MNDAAGLDAAGSGQDGRRLGIVDAGCQLRRGEAAEHHGMNGADASACQHRHHRFGDHRHVDDDAIALLDTKVLQHGAERRHLVAQLGVGVRARGLGDGTVVDQRFLPAAHRNVSIEAIPGRVALCAHEPAAILAGVGIEHLVPGLVPVDLARSLGPEGFRVSHAGGIDLGIATRHGSSSEILTAGAVKNDCHLANSAEVAHGMQGCRISAPALTIFRPGRGGGLPRSFGRDTPMLRGFGPSPIGSVARSAGIRLHPRTPR